MGETRAVAAVARSKGTGLNGINPGIVLGRRGGFGRQKGTPNKDTEIKRDLKRFLEDPTYQNNVMRRIELGDAPHLERYFWEFVYGRPKVVIEIPTPSPTKSMEKMLDALSKPERKQLAELSRKMIQGELRIIEVKSVPVKADQ